MNEQDEALLDRYLDGLLAGSEKAAFEQRVAKDAELRGLIERQKKIDAASVRTLPPAPDPRAIVEAARREQRKIVRPAFGRRMLVAAVTLAAALLIALAVVRSVYPEKTDEPGKKKLAHLSFEQAYSARLAAGFKPDWVCKDDAELQSSYKKAIGQPLRLAKLPPGVEAIGLAYFDTLSPWTIALLARVDGREVIVFGDPANYDAPVTLAEGSKLHLHKRVIDKVVLHELSPFEQPRVLPAFEKP